MTQSSSDIDVAVGVILRDGTCYVTKRSETQHQGGKWEFPGGKLEGDETPFNALVRELREEVGISILDGEAQFVITFEYPEKTVHLHVFWVHLFNGEPESKEGLEGRWVALSELPSLTFPEANQPIIDSLLALTK